MSAYQVSSDTIDLLVAAADRWRVTFDNREGTDAARLHACSHRDEAGQLLTDENARSVAFRYSEPAAVEPYRYTYLDLDLAARQTGAPVPVLVLASVRCLRYQSCETPDYSETRAARFLDAIEHAAVHQLIEQHDAPWGYERKVA
jgi:hypothetical protein